MLASRTSFLLLSDSSGESVIKGSGGKNRGRRVCVGR